MLKKTPADSVIIARRTAAAVLNMFVMQTLGMGTMAHKFHGDRDEDWAVVDVSEIRALKHGDLVATVTFGGEGATLAIPDPRLLATRKHRSDFNPIDFGFHPRVMNWRKEMEPYVIVAPVPDNVHGLHLPVHHRQRALQHGKVNVRRSV